MLLNILHRTALGPRYSIFREQQQTVHDLGIKGTVFLHYKDLFNPAALKDVFNDRDRFGDELGLALHDLSGPGMEKLEGNLPAIWLFDLGRKREILSRILAKWREIFAKDPVSVASYHFDSSSLAILKELAPGVETVVGGCFEEGVRVFHGCNHSWYLFNEGMPWNPWYPSKSHTLRPAQDEADAAGVVAVPHLVRDMSLSYEGRNDFWASHPPNVVRGMGNDASFNPYDLNLIDQYRMQEDWNGGYSYYNSFVSAQWLTWNHNSEYPPEVCWHLYRTMLNYLAALKKEGAVKDMTLGEYGAWHRQNRPYGRPEVYLAKEMLYDSRKHYFWFIDGKARYLVDATQGGSIGDLRPYTGKVAVATGPDTPHRENASYPFLIQSQYRTGFPTHWEDGARTTLQITHQGETFDLATARTKVAGISCSENETTVTLTPAALQFKNGLTGQVLTTLTFVHNTGRLEIHRRVDQLSDPRAELTLTESFKGAPGKTEYPVDMHGIELAIDGQQAAKIPFNYSGLWHNSAGASKAVARIPQTQCTAELLAKSPCAGGRVRDGHLFTPYFHLALDFNLKGNGEIKTWLMLTPTTA